MKEYIKREIIINDIDNIIEILKRPPMQEIDKKLVKTFKLWKLRFLNTPLADVAEVKHGKWLYHERVSSHDGTISGYSCSKCSAFVDEGIFDIDEFHKDFCGCCGAKMDEKGEDNGNL